MEWRWLRSETFSSSEKYFWLRSEPFSSSEKCFWLRSEPFSSSEKCFWLRSEPFRVHYFNVLPRLHRVGPVERSLLYGGQGVCFPLTAFVTDLILFWRQSTGNLSEDKKYSHFSLMFFPFSHLFFAFSRFICDRTDGIFLAQRSSLCR